MMFPYLDNESQLKPSYPLNRVMDFISSYFDLHPGQIKCNKSRDGETVLELIIPLVEDNLLLIEMSMNYLSFDLQTPFEALQPGKFSRLCFTSSRSPSNRLMG